MEQQVPSPNTVHNNGTSASPFHQLPSPAWSPNHTEPLAEEVLPMLDPISPSLPPPSSQESSLSSDSIAPCISSVGTSNKEEGPFQKEDNDQQHDTESRETTPNAPSVITVDSSICISRHEPVVDDNDDDQDYLPEDEISDDITEEEMNNHVKSPIDTDEDEESAITTTDDGHLADYNSNTSTTSQSTDMDVTSDDEEEPFALDEDEIEAIISDWFEEMLCMELDPPEDFLWWCVVCERQFVLPADVVHHTREQHGVLLPTPLPVGRPPIDMYIVSTHSTLV
ncbi:hypothetical protein LRAMOSA05250 [Lichtheimia ramosa]|uniref:C2H2-type domain-containing protein n=1 Tax=Lichtheimia ramosa TaxID=688394 RepID=A0A077WZR2_9FUNG|nr:hypothetical protein LRAMOSA05250 [Lichtheimia ramosa]